MLKTTLLLSNYTAGVFTATRLWVVCRLVIAHVYQASFVMHTDSIGSAGWYHFLEGNGSIEMRLIFFRVLRNYSVERDSSTAVFPYTFLETL